MGYQMINCQMTVAFQWLAIVFNWFYIFISTYNPTLSDKGEALARRVSGVVGPSDSEAETGMSGRFLIRLVLWVGCNL